jgi:hypothetical protein
MDGTTAEDGYTSSTAWESSSQSEVRGHPGYSLDSVESSSLNLHVTSISPSPRSSSDSERKSPNNFWQDAQTSLPERRDTLATIHSVETPSLVDPSFDENVLRSLCELDVRYLLSPCDIYFA